MSESAMSESAVDKRVYVPDEEWDKAFLDATAEDGRTFRDVLFHSKNLQRYLKSQERPTILPPDLILNDKFESTQQLHADLRSQTLQLTDKCIRVFNSPETLDARRSTILYMLKGYDTYFLLASYLNAQALPATDTTETDDDIRQKKAILEHSMDYILRDGEYLLNPNIKDTLESGIRSGAIPSSSYADMRVQIAQFLTENNWPSPIKEIVEEKSSTPDFSQDEQGDKLSSSWLKAEQNATGEKDTPKKGAPQSAAERIAVRMKKWKGQS